jgi:ubiquitin-protein ligase
MQYPNDENPLNVEAGRLMRENMADFEDTVAKTMKGGHFFGVSFADVRKRK